MTRKKKIEGLGGWLILPIIGLFISVPAILLDIIFTASIYKFDSLVAIFYTIDIVLFVWIIVTLIAIFKKKKYAPNVMISFLIGNIVIQLGLSAYVMDYSSVLGPVISAAIWIPYFVLSERVKNTFVN